MTFDFTKIISDLGQAVSSYGLAVVLLLIIVVAIICFLWALAVYVRDKIVTPLVDSHLQFVGSVNERNNHHSDKLNKILEETQRQSRIIERVPAAISDQTAILKLAIEKQGGGIGTRR